MKNNRGVATETVKYLTLFTASLDKNQIYFLVKKNSSTRDMCTDSRRFIAARWSKGFHMCCSGGNILTICFCLPSVFWPSSVLVNLTPAVGISSAKESTGMAASFHMAKLGTAEGRKVFAPTLGALTATEQGSAPSFPQAEDSDWQWVTATARERLK